MAIFSAGKDILKDVDSDYLSLPKIIKHLLKFWDVCERVNLDQFLEWAV